MLGYNAALYDDVDNKWQFDRVHDLSTTCYIKYIKNHYSYIQPVDNHNDKNFIYTDKNQIIIETSNVYPSPEMLGGIYKNIISLYSLVMSKHQSQFELIGTDKKRIMNFRSKLLFFLFYRCFKVSQKLLNHQ